MDLRLQASCLEEGAKHVFAPARAAVNPEWSAGSASVRNPDSRWAGRKLRKVPKSGPLNCREGGDWRYGPKPSSGVMLRSKIRRDQRCVERSVGLESQKKLQKPIDVRVATSRLYSVEGKTKYVQSAFGKTTGKMIQMPT
jgi:hypothetical protein